MPRPESQKTSLQVMLPPDILRELDNLRVTGENRAEKARYIITNWIVTEMKASGRTLFKKK